MVGGVRLELASQKRVILFMGNRNDFNLMPTCQFKTPELAEKYYYSKLKAPLANALSRILPYFIKSKVTLQTCSIIIHFSAAYAIVQSCFQSIVKQKLCESAYQTLVSLYWNKLVLMAIVLSSKIQPISFNTKCPQDGYSPT